MTLKDLAAVADTDIMITAFDCDGPAYYLTNYLRGSAGVMSLEIAKITTYGGLYILAHIDISPAVLRILDKESNTYYDKNKTAPGEF